MVPADPHVGQDVFELAGLGNGKHLVHEIGDRYPSSFRRRSAIQGLDVHDADNVVEIHSVDREPGMAGVQGESH